MTALYIAIKMIWQRDTMAIKMVKNRGPYTATTVVCDQRPATVVVWDLGLYIAVKMVCVQGP
jgi:hypothetical protein